MNNNKKRYIAVFLLSALVTILFAFFTLSYYEKRDYELFSTQVAFTKNKLQERMQSYTYALKAMRGLMYASTHVSAQEWKAFIDHLETQALYPGIQGLGYTQMIPPAMLTLTEKKLSHIYDRNITVYPAGTRAMYSAITYLEPQDKRNQVALGYDMYSEPIRHAAMQRACDTNKPVLSAPVTLVQEIEGPIQYGVLLYLPVYAPQKPLHSIESRQAALTGFVYSPFRLHDLIGGIFGEEMLLSFALYDATQPHKPILLYGHAPDETSIPRFSQTEHLDIAGRVWRLEMRSGSLFDAHTRTMEPYIIVALVAGIIVLILGFLFQSVHIRTRLEASKQWLSSMLASSSDGLHIVNTQGMLVAWSPSFLTMLGYTEEEAKTLHVQDWDPGINEHTIEDEIAQLSQEKSLLIAAVHRRKEGTTFPVELHIRAFTIENERYIFASARDISERKQAHQAFIQARKAAERYLDIVDVMILVLDKDKNVIEINRKGCEILGYSRDEILGKNWIDHFIPERLRGAIHEVGNTLLNPYNTPVKVYENPIVTKKGEERLILWRNTTLFDETGSYVGILTSGEDVTEQRVKDKLFMMQTRQAQMGEMISMIAHQWRQPLSVINTIAAQMRLDEMFKEEQNSTLVKNLIDIETQTLHLSQTITDFKDFFKPNKSKESTTLAEIIRGAVELVERALGNHNIQTVYDFHTQGALFTYRSELLQVIMTLLKNSIDAFETVSCPDPTITFTVDQTRTHAVMKLTDNAGGIPSSVIRDIFLPYFTTKGASKGTGLGLYMAKTVIEEHCGGSITVSSDHTHTTTFTITLPLGHA